MITDGIFWTLVVLAGLALIIALRLAQGTKGERENEARLARMEQSLEQIAAQDRDARDRDERARSVEAENLRSMQESVRRMTEEIADSQRAQRAEMAQSLQAARADGREADRRLERLTLVSLKAHEDAIDQRLEGWREETAREAAAARDAQRLDREAVLERLAALGESIGEERRVTPLFTCLAELKASVERRGEELYFLSTQDDPDVQRLPVCEWPEAWGEPRADALMEVFRRLREDAIDPPLTTRYAAVYFPLESWRRAAEANDLLRQAARRDGVLLTDAQSLPALLLVSGMPTADPVSPEVAFRDADGNLRKGDAALKKAGKRLRQAAEAMEEARTCARSARRAFRGQEEPEVELLIAARSEEPYGRGDWD